MFILISFINLFNYQSTFYANNCLVNTPDSSFWEMWCQNKPDLMDVIGHWKIGRERWRDVIRRYMKETGVQREEAQDRRMWRCADDKIGKRPKKGRYSLTLRRASGPTIRSQLSWAVRWLLAVDSQAWYLGESPCAVDNTWGPSPAAQCTASTQDGARQLRGDTWLKLFYFTQYVTQFFLSVCACLLSI